MSNEQQAWVEIVVTRGVRGRRAGERLARSLKPGDRLQVPEDREEDGIPALRWWIHSRKGQLPHKAAAEIEQLVRDNVLKPDVAIQALEQLVAEGDEEAVDALERVSSGRAGETDDDDDDAGDADAA